MRTRVVSNSNIKGPYYKLILNPPCKIEALPGQFLMIRPCTDHCPSDPLLSRPFSIHRINPDNQIEILYKVVGKGTALLTNVEEGDGIEVIGPLGNGFKKVFSDEAPMSRGLTKEHENVIPAQAGIQGAGKGLDSHFRGNDRHLEVFSSETIVIAGGIGIAPMLGLIEDIKSRDPQKKIIVFLGGRGETDLLCVEELKAIATEVIISTNDGSAGMKGYVTDILEAYLQKKLITHHSSLITSLYACGPTPMLQRISEITEPLQIDSYFSLEANMACGIGLCMGCAIRRRDGKGYYLVCTDGPVFRGASVDLTAGRGMDSHFRGNDGHLEAFSSET